MYSSSDQITSPAEREHSNFWTARTWEEGVILGNSRLSMKIEKGAFANTTVNCTCFFLVNDFLPHFSPEWWDFKFPNLVIVELDSCKCFNMAGVGATGFKSATHRDTSWNAPKWRCISSKSYALPSRGGVPTKAREWRRMPNIFAPSNQPRGVGQTLIQNQPRAAYEA